MEFIKFEDALKKLAISTERLNELREEGQLRAYRDGASWKFRADEIQRFADEGVPDPPPPSDVSLIDASELVDASSLSDLANLDEDDLQLAEDSDVGLKPGDSKLGRGATEGSELELADLEDTVTAGGSDAGGAPRSSSPVEEPSDPSDSILLSEEALGEAASGPPSTIIGKSDIEVEDADLELVTDDAEESDVNLTSGASDVLSSHVAGSGVLDDAEKAPSASSAFEKLEELEIDLAAESSRILNPEDAAEIRRRASAPAKPKRAEGDSDLTLGEGELAGEDEGTDPIPGELAADDEGTDPVPAEAEAVADKTKKKDAKSSDLELATDEDDFVLAEAGGSDITLDSGDSGINLIDPSDSGLALDDIPLEMGGSAILESLALDSDKKKKESQKSLVAKAREAGPKKAKPAAAIQTDDDFRLTPLGDSEEDGDSSSQVIALDAGMEDLGAGDAGILSEDAFAEASSEEAVLTEDYDGGPADDFGGGGYPGAVAARTDIDYSVMNILGLGACVVLLLLGVVVMMDMMRNIWSWHDNLALNDSLLDSLLGLFGLR